ncbi:putative transcription factor WD40-like family [Lupinus albus]|uniref:Putative transcription factor WD40-like family n=1 Tax=Lupinus albus TaxID=3870 RepID=A0A6A4NX44_LUPAL|nr:putative transcription factor WD40-like family [Lupinus albus]
MVKGDRFIPNRSLMDLDQAQSLLTNTTNKSQNIQFSIVVAIVLTVVFIAIVVILTVAIQIAVVTEKYREIIDGKLNLNSEGKAFRMLVFRGSPKSSRKSIRHIDAMREEEAVAFQKGRKQHRGRQMPKREVRVLDAPNIVNDYYTNILDWGKNNTLAVALGSEMYLWNANNRNVSKLFEANDNDRPTSVAWSENTKFIAVGFLHSKLQLWDAETSKPIRDLEGHSKRVAAIAWNGQMLSSGSHDKSIINHDVRARRNVICKVKAHRAEICGLKWSRRGNMLSSGGNENHIYVWDSSKMSSSNYLHCFKDHCAAVKALAWCPYDSDVLASGGGTEDKCIKIWNVRKGTCICSIDTEAQAR